MVDVPEAPNGLKNTEKTETEKYNESEKVRKRIGLSLNAMPDTNMNKTGYDPNFFENNKIGLGYKEVPVFKTRKEFYE